MPMIELRYDSKQFSQDAVYLIGSNFEQWLRDAIKKVRPKHSNEYGVTTEVDPFGIAFNQPDLRICIFYHQEWGFAADELVQFLEEIKTSVEDFLPRLNLGEGIKAKIRFYARTGHASASIP